MTQAEKRYFKEMFDNIDTKFDCIDEKLTIMHRGIYGDKQNDMPGLLGRQAQDEIRFQSIEEDQKKVKWTIKVVGGIITASITVLTLINLLKAI